MSESTLDARLKALSDATMLLGRFVRAETVADVEAVKTRAGERTGLGLDLTVVALAGSTGSGKSTLFNALAGLDLAEAGVRRPTTTVALACVWGGMDADPLLDWLAVPSRRRVARQSPLDDTAHPLDGLVLLDLPDHDSMVTEHRVEVDRLVGLVDVVVWVTDPVKYADALLHEEYLATFTKHGSVVLVVLNQIDRLNAAEQRACLTDLRRLVRRDGLLDVEVLAMSAGSGDGVDVLRARLEDVVDTRLAATQRLSADVAVLASTVRNEAGLAATRAHRARSTDHDELAVDDRDSLVRELTHVLEIDAVVAAVHDSAVLQASEALRWPVDRSDVPDAPEPRTVSSEPARRLLLGYLDQYVQPLPPVWADQVRHELVGAAGSMPERWAEAAATASNVEPPPPGWWAQHRQRQWAVLAAGVASALVALVLVGLVVAGSAVPVWVWVVPALLAGVSGLGAVVLSHQVRGAREEWAQECAQASRADLTALIGRDTDSRLDLPLRAQRRDFDRAHESLTAAGA
ncbi:MAG: GTPase [Jiangellales bacterium]